MPHLAATIALLMALAAPACAAAAPNIVRHSPLGGVQRREGRDLWNMMRVGDSLQLTREPHNPHDANAVRVLWRNEMLGYIPRRENSDVARQMDLGAPVKARIVHLKEARNPWQRIEFEVYVEASPAPR